MYLQYIGSQCSNAVLKRVYLRNGKEDFFVQVCCENVMLNIIVTPQYYNVMYMQYIGSQCSNAVIKSVSLRNAKRNLIFGVDASTRPLPSVINPLKNHGKN